MSNKAPKKVKAKNGKDKAMGGTKLGSVRDKVVNIPSNTEFDQALQSITVNSDNTLTSASKDSDGRFRIDMSEEAIGKVQEADMNAAQTNLNPTSAITSAKSSGKQSKGSQEIPDKIKVTDKVRSKNQKDDNSV